MENKEIKIVINDGNNIIDSSKSKITDEDYIRFSNFVISRYINYIEDIIETGGYLYLEMQNGRLISYQVKEIPKSLIDLINERR